MKKRVLLLKVAGLQSNAYRHVAACVQIASLDGHPGAAGNGPLRRLDTSEVRSLDKRGNEYTVLIYVHK